MEDGSSAAFPRMGATFVHSLVECDVEKPKFEWGKAAEEGLMEIARCSIAHLGRTVAMFFVMTLVSKMEWMMVGLQRSPARGLLLCIVGSNVMWKN